MSIILSVERELGIDLSIICKMALYWYNWLIFEQKVVNKFYK